jgi:myosin heavy subunit
MFTMEQEEYKKENIQWSQIKFEDNQLTIDLIEHPKNMSIFKLLDEECLLKGNDINLLKKYNDNL